MQISMLGDWLAKIADFFLGIFAFVPQTIYFLYASIASLVDVLQFLIRKLAGLDVYWVTNSAGEKEQQTGDMVVSFIRGILGIDKVQGYSAITTVFWSLVLFGVILLFLSTIIAIIKAHYNFDANKSSPMKIVGGSLKYLATMAIVPAVTLMGVYLSSVILSALDSVTSSAGSASIAGVFESGAIPRLQPGETSTGYTTYSSYDYFSAGSYTNNPTFSGMIFKVAANSVNRVRRKDYRLVKSQQPVASGNIHVPWETFSIFYSDAQDDEICREEIATQIDYAFANNLRLMDGVTVSLIHNDDAHLSNSYILFSAFYAGGLINVTSFSKYNVGLVWYFYDLWGFNWILAFFGGVIVAVMLGNIVFGLMTRLLQIFALFLIFPALIGIMPLDEGQAFQSWRKQFMSDILMAFGAVVGMNIFFLILPFFNSISFFGNVFLDGIMNMFVIMAGLTLVKKFIALTSKFVGSESANDVGQTTRQEVTASAMKGVTKTFQAGQIGTKLLKPAIGAARIGIGGASNAAKQQMARKIAKDANLMMRGDLYHDRNSSAQTKEENKLTPEEEKRYQKLKTAQNKQKDKQNAKELKKMSKDQDFVRAMGGNITGENFETAREAYDRLQTLDKKERAGILKKAEGIEDKKAGEGKNSLRAELGMMNTKGSKEKYQQHQQSTLDKKYKRAQFISQLVGSDPSKVQRGEAVINENGEVEVKQGSNVLKGVGDAVLDLTKTTFKAFGQLSGGSALWKQLSDAGAIDAAKKGFQDFVTAAGGDYTKGVWTKEGNFMGWELETKDQKDKRKNKENEQARDALNKLLQQDIASKKQVVDAIRELAATFEASSRSSTHPAGSSSTPPSSGGGSGGSGGEAS